MSTAGQPARASIADDARLSAWRALLDARVVVQTVTRRFEADADIVMEWYHLLLLLHEADGPLSQARIQETLGLSQSSVSRLLTRLEREHLIRREISQKDRRVNLMVLTPKGHDVLVRATPVYRAAVQHHFGARLADDEILGLAEVLSTLRGDGERRTESSGPELLTFGESVLSIDADAVVVGDVLVVRDALEPAVLLEASIHRTDDDIRHLRSLLAAMARLTTEPVEFFRSDWNLHRALVDLCRNDVLRTAYRTALDLLEAHVLDVTPTSNLDEYIARRLVVHSAIVDAVESGDPDRVRAAAHDHAFTGVRPY